MAQDQVKINLSQTVSSIAPVIPTVRHRMFLSNLDLYSITYHVRFLFFYKTESSEEFCTIVEKLKRSLSSVLVEFYPFAGRLDMQGGESGRPEVDCNDEGVEFVEASIDMTFEDLEKYDFQHKSFFKELARTKENGYNALLSIQATAFLEGGICIGTTLHHSIADANSFCYFMKCWAEQNRGIPILKKPEHMRTVFKRDKKNYAIPKISFKGEEVVTDRIKGAQVLKFLAEDILPLNSECPLAQKEIANVCTSTVIETNTENNSIPVFMKEETELEFSTFHFSEKMIRNLKERAEASSSFVAVAAHFWRCITEACKIPENQPIHFVVYADCRDRLKPPLPPTYFGNCICPGVARTTARQLLEQDICFAAGLIQEVINSCVTEVQLNNYIDWIESRDVGSASIIGSGYYVKVGSSHKVPFYDIDYGWGKPLNVQMATIDIGAMVLFPGRDDRRSIDLSTCLPRPHMETLKRILMINADNLLSRL